MPGVLTSEIPCFNASPLRGTTCPKKPTGIATAMPVATSTRPPRAGKSASTRAYKSMPASPACAVAGNGSSRSSRLTGTFIGLRDALPALEFVTPKTIEPARIDAEIAPKCSVRAEN